MKKYKINLLKKNQEDVNKKLTFFLLHYLRYIVVVTATITLGVFFYRLLVDTEIADLKERIPEKAEIIKVTNPIVVKTDEINYKLKTIKKIVDEQSGFLKQVDYVFKNVPQRLVLDNFAYENKRISISGNSMDVYTIKQFAERLKKSKIFKNVAIDSVVKSNFGFTFAISILI